MISASFSNDVFIDEEWLIVDPDIVLSWCGDEEDEATTVLGMVLLEGGGNAMAGGKNWFCMRF